MGRQAANTRSLNYLVPNPHAVVCFPFRRSSCYMKEASCISSPQDNLGSPQARPQTTMRRSVFSRSGHFPLLQPLATVLSVSSHKQSLRADAEQKAGRPEELAATRVCLALFGSQALNEHSPLYFPSFSPTSFLLTVQSLKTEI